MLTHLLDQVLRIAANRLADRRDQATSRREQGGTSGNSDAGEAADDVEAPVVVGDTLSSPLQALRQGRRGATGSEPVALDMEARRRHVYILGRTGVGKTELQTTLFLADVAAGRGVALLDARGDLVDKCLIRLADRFSPDTLAKRLIILDFRESAPFQSANEAVVGFNPLAESGGDAYTRAFFCLDVLRQQWGDGAVGVQTQETLRNTLLTLAMAGPRPGVCWTLLEIEPLLMSAAFRRQALTQVTDSGVRRFWERFDALGAQQSQWVGPVLNKVSNWVSRPRLRHVIGQDSGLSFRRLFEERPDAIVLVCLAADELFKATAGLLGMLITTAIARAIMRSDRPVYERRHTTVLYLDEFESVAGASGEILSEIISEGRRFGLSLTCSHQSTVQLEPRLRGLIRNVVGVQAYFSVGGLDADQIAGELPSDEPKAVLRTVLLSQKIGEALLVRPNAPLTRIRTRYTPDPKVPEQKVADLRRAGVARWGRSASAVAAELAARERLYSGEADTRVSPSPSSPAPNSRRAPRMAANAATSVAGTDTGTDAGPHSGAGMNTTDTTDGMAADSNATTAPAPPISPMSSVPAFEVRDSTQEGKPLPARKRGARKTPASSASSASGASGASGVDACAGNDQPDRPENQSGRKERGNKNAG